MNEEQANPPSQDEARAALAAAAQTKTEIRKNVAASCAGPVLIWWGFIWMALMGYAQFRSQRPNYVCWALIVAGFIGNALISWLGPQPVKRPVDWRGGLFWLALFLFAALWFAVLEPWPLLDNLSSTQSALQDHRTTTYFMLVPMFGYIVIGLFAGRFLAWLGLVMTAFILAGYYFIWDYFYLWMALVGGGMLIISGVFIRKFWK